MSECRSVRRVIIVSRVKRNPYVSLLCDGLRQPDLGLQPSVTRQFSWGWMWRRRRDVDVLHIHWLELFFVCPTLGRSLKRWVSVMLGLLLGRVSGVCIVYTVHNILQHEGQRAGLVRWGNRVVFTLAHAVHVHDHETADLLRDEWGRRRDVYVIPHGNYVSAYPNECTRAEARKRLGLDEASFVYLFLGRVRPYKGIEELILAFKSLDEDAVLLVAGEVHEPSYEQSVRELAPPGALDVVDERIRLHLEFVDDEDLQTYFGACDICVLPYQHVTTSGAAILSFSFGVPIIAPRLGCFVQLVGDGERGLLYDAGATDGLRDALRLARQSDLGKMSAACTKFTESLDWKRIARQHAAMYQGAARGSEPCS